MCKVFSGDSIQDELDISDLESGVYFIKTFFTSSKIAIGRFVVTR
jgi:hypothetical protein